jgi:hypothetical protein
MHLGLDTQPLRDQLHFVGFVAATQPKPCNVVVQPPHHVHVARIGAVDSRIDAVVAPHDVEDDLQLAREGNRLVMPTGVASEVQSTLASGNARLHFIHCGTDAIDDLHA